VAAELELAASVFETALWMVAALPDDAVRDFVTARAIVAVELDTAVVRKRPMRRTMVAVDVTVAAIECVIARDMVAVELDIAVRIFTACLCIEAADVTAVAARVSRCLVAADSVAAELTVVAVRVFLACLIMVAVEVTAVATIACDPAFRMVAVELTVEAVSRRVMARAIVPVEPDRALRIFPARRCIEALDVTAVAVSARA
jgi:hypothetical protein